MGPRTSSSVLLSLVLYAPALAASEFGLAFPLDLLPALGGPEFDALVLTGNDHLAVQGRPVAQVRGDGDPALLVGGDRLGAGEEHPRGVDGGFGATFLRALADVLAHFAEPFRGVDGQTASGELADIGALFERLTEVRREDEAALVVQRVLVPPDERCCHHFPSPADFRKALEEGAY